VGWNPLQNLARCGPGSLPSSKVPAWKSLSRRRGLVVQLAIDLAYEQGRDPTRHVIEVETAMYRLDNAAKHGDATMAQVEVVEDSSASCLDGNRVTPSRA
jgi:hypothetical protein